IAPGYRRTRGTMQKPFRPNAHCVFSLKNFPVPLAAFVNGLVAPIMLVNGPFGAPAASNENDASDQLSTTAFPARRIFNGIGFGVVRGTTEANDNPTRKSSTRIVAPMSASWRNPY